MDLTYLPIPTMLGLFLCFGLGCDSNAPNNEEASIRVSDHVNALASERMQGRETGTQGEILASLWLDSLFNSMDLVPRGEVGSLQKFTYKPHPPMQMHGMGNSASLGMALVQEVEGRNVLFASGDSETAQWGVLAAHYDHLGFGGEGSLFRGERQMHAGADDNASGVAAMIELARRFSERSPENEILWAGFSGEEKGLWGSNHFCKNAVIGLDSIKYMINLDMVGRMRGDTLAVYGVGTSPKWMELLESCNKDSLTLIPSESGVGPSDHTSFYLVDIPVLHFFTGQHPDYHKPSDTPEKINVDGILKVVDFVERIMRELDRKSEWAFTPTVDQDQDSTPSFKVTLGVIPDYLFDGIGMRIDGVSDGRPAANAKLRRGDVVLSIDTVKVVDMMSYMTALSLFAEGQTSRVVVKRGSDTVAVDVTWD